MTASSGSTESLFVSSFTRPRREGSPTMATSPSRSSNFDGNEARVSAGRSLAACAGPSHFPSRVMATGTMSYLSGSSASMTERAERIDTSCSPERPPKITPMRSFLGIRLQPQRTQSKIPINLVTGYQGYWRAVAASKQNAKSIWKCNRIVEQSGIFEFIIRATAIWFSSRLPFGKGIKGKGLPPVRPLRNPSRQGGEGKRIIILKQKGGRSEKRRVG